MDDGVDSNSILENPVRHNVREMLDHESPDSEMLRYSRKQVPEIWRFLEPLEGDLDG